MRRLLLRELRVHHRMRICRIDMSEQPGGASRLAGWREQINAYSDHASLVVFSGAADLDSGVVVYWLCDGSKQMSDQVKPCPYYEHSTHRHAVDHEPAPFRDHDWYRVICLDCGAMGPRATTPAEAIAAWNQRASDERCDKYEKALLGIIGIQGNLADKVVCLHVIATMRRFAIEAIGNPATLDEMEALMQRAQPLPEPPKEGE